MEGTAADIASAGIEKPPIDNVPSQPHGICPARSQMASESSAIYETERWASLCRQRRSWTNRSDGAMKNIQESHDTGGTLVHWTVHAAVTEAFYLGYLDSMQARIGDRVRRWRDVFKQGRVRCISSCDVKNSIVIEADLGRVSQAHGFQRLYTTDMTEMREVRKGAQARRTTRVRQHLPCTLRCLCLLSWPCLGRQSLKVNTPLISFPSPALSTRGMQDFIRLPARFPGLPSRGCTRPVDQWKTERLRSWLFLSSEDFTITEPRHHDTKHAQAVGPSVLPRQFGLAAVGGFWPPTPGLEPADCRIHSAATTPKDLLRWKHTGLAKQ
ncbi:unnamed protein product [Diplocarpon coronariae]